MIDMLTYFGEISISSANAAAPDVTSPRIVDMIDACRLEDSVPYLRVSARVIEVPSQDVTVSIVGGSETSGSGTAAVIDSPETLALRTFKAEGLKVGDTLKFDFPLAHTKYIQAKVNTKGTAKLAVALEFGA